MCHVGKTSTCTHNNVVCACDVCMCTAGGDLRGSVGKLGCHVGETDNVTGSIDCDVCISGSTHSLGCVVDGSHATAAS